MCMKYAVKSCQGRFANLAFFKPDYEVLALFGNHKKLDKIWLFFSQKGLAVEKDYLSCIFIANLF